MARDLIYQALLHDCVVHFSKPKQSTYIAHAHAMVCLLPLCLMIHDMFTI